jgi:hypothetical protein
MSKGRLSRQADVMEGGSMRELKDGPGGEEAERRLQREVLAYELVEHPLPISVTELQEELGWDAEIEAAVGALVAAGLLERQGGEIVPTPAAIRFNRIEPIEPPSP